MTSLKVLCGICNEFYSDNDIIYGTKNCGHVFHYHCLTRWLSRSQTCPQCRSNCHRQNIHRIYLNFNERTDDDDLEPPVNLIQWVPIDVDISTHMASANIPPGAIQVGTDHDGFNTYVARACFKDDLIPVNYVPQKRAAYGPWGYHAHLLKETIEVLVNVDYKWVRARDGNVPEGAIPTGYTVRDEDLYTGRGIHDGRTLLGKVHPCYGCLFMPYRELEVEVQEYEVLVIEPKKQTES